MCVCVGGGAAGRGGGGGDTEGYIIKETLYIEFSNFVTAYEYMYFLRSCTVHVANIKFFICPTNKHNAATLPIT